MSDFIDFADITNQINRREMNRIYEFNLMLVGTTGIGKSTLVKSIFQGMIKPSESVHTAKLNDYEDLLEENGVKLRLRCIETSNYDRHSPADYAKYIDEQLKNYFKAQRRHSSWNIKDTLVHCCLYLITPYGKMKLRKEDIDCMRALHEKVNLIPVIAKADTFNASQLAKFKENILVDLEQNKINYFKFQHDDKEDEERFKSVKMEAEKFPFAVVAADEPLVENKKNRWIRTTIAGSIDIADSKKCDFYALSKLLVRHCMLDLIDTTHVKHYAKFKTELLEATKLQGGRNLESMGFEPHEIRRIEQDMASSKGCGVKFIAHGAQTPDKRLVNLENELQPIRARLQALKTKPPTLPRNPQLVSGLEAK